MLCVLRCGCASDLLTRVCEPRAPDVHACMGPQDFVLGRLREIDGVTLAEPAGAFYVLPRMDAFFGKDAHAEGFGDVPDPDTLCR